MKSGIRTAMALVVLLASAGVSLAQHEGHQIGGAPTGDGACLAHVKEGLRIVETADRQLEEARQANSPQRMRAAISELQAALAEIRTQLSLCIRPSAGGSGTPGIEGMDHSTIGQSDGAAPVGKTVDPVCGTEVDPASAPKATLDGKTYSFCSEANKAKFLKSPSTYVKR